MITVRSPLRISLGGGGTDLPSYYRREGGFLVAGAIDRYVTITLHRTFEPGLIVKTSRLERVASVDEVEHPLVREALRLAGVTDTHLEITSLADIPAGTGLGSSGSFTTALLKALHTMARRLVGPAEVAEQAASIEIERLGEPVGKQDPYIAAHGGVASFRFDPDDRVHVTPVCLPPDRLADLEDALVLFFTGTSRSAPDILREQDTRSRHDDAEMLENLRAVKEGGVASLAAIEAGDVAALGRLMDEHWERKKRRSGAMSSDRIDGWYRLARANGALGGKLVGAGGGGFLLFCCEERLRLRRVLSEAGLREVRFRFDFEGTKVLTP